jgi:hypothetical protein
MKHRPQNNEANWKVNDKRMHSAEKSKNVGQDHCCILSCHLLNLFSLTTESPSQPFLERLSNEIFDPGIYKPVSHDQLPSGA